ncbi:MAG: hypothetical protein V5A33_07085 [Halobacteriales archaeon]
MQRRTLLRSLGAAGLGAALAGCLSGANPGGDGDTTVPSDPDTASPTPTDRHTDTRPGDERTAGDGTTSPTEDDGTNTPDQRGDSSWDPAAEEPFEIVQIGSRDGVAFPENNRPHGVAILNELAREREVRVSIDRGTADGAEYDRTFTFPAGGFALFRLKVPGQYEIAFRGPGTRLGSITVDRERFDCNSSQSRLGLTENGIEDYGVLSTAVACPAPDIARTDLTVTDRDCASSSEGGDATVSFEGEQVVVDGTIATATPCRVVEIAGTDYGETGDRLTVAIGTSPSDGVCQQCLGAVGYEATIEFEHDLPGEVVVEHRSRDGSRTVNTAEPGKTA